jgi:hypothetical protein
VGFFNLQSFLDAQRCTWLFRAKKQCIDNWSYDLHALAPRFDPLLIRKVDIDMYEHPILYEICVSYEKFYSAFCNRYRNYKECYIFENAAFRDTATGT